jgi:hypothetical protein
MLAAEHHDVRRTGRLSMKAKWFGVKVLIRTELVGRAVRRGRSYDPDATLVEEQVRIVRAANGAAAAQRAKRLARLGLPRSFRNAHRQLVRHRILPAWSAYELFDPPREGREVFSDTRRFSKRVSDEDVAAELLSSALSPRDQQRRRQFLDEAIARGLDAYMTAPNLPLQRTISPRVRRSRIEAPTRRRSRR